MDFWIMSIFMVAPKLTGLCGVIDKRVESLALNMNRDAMTLFNEIIDLSDKKVKVINLKVMRERMWEKLDFVEREVYLLFLKRYSFEQIGLELEMSKSRVARILNKASAKCARALLSLGFSEEKLEKEYGDIALLKRYVIKFKRCFNKNEEKIEISKTNNKNSKTENNEAGENSPLREGKIITYERPSKKQDENPPPANEEYNYYY